MLVAALMAGALLYKLLPGVLAASLGFMVAKALAGRLSWSKAPQLAAGVVIGAPVLAIVGALMGLKGIAFSAVSQYQSLMEHLATTVLELRIKLPASIAEHIPQELETVQAWLAGYLKSQASAMTHLGTEWLHSGLFAFVGLVVGALISTVPQRKRATFGLSDHIRTRGRTYIQTFKQIVVAQFWIASFNALCTAVFLLGALPLADITVPYSGALVAFTLVASLIPVVGNLLCNGVLAIAGVSVSPLVGLLCLGFLILIHKAEYFINAKVVGSQTNTAVWELLAVIFIGEAVFGIPGLVAAPLFYAYAKTELVNAKLL